MNQVLDRFRFEIEMCSVFLIDFSGRGSFAAAGVGG